MSDEIESIPTFLCQGERIVEVVFSNWRRESDGRWTLADPVDPVKLSDDVNRVVFEFPMGCYETQIRGATRGVRMGLRESSSALPLMQCRRGHGYETAKRGEDAETAQGEFLRPESRT